MPDFDPLFFAKLLGCVWIALQIANQVKSLRAKAPPATPQPLIVELAKEFTPIERTEKLEARVEQVDVDRRQSVSRCYDEMRKAVEGLRGEAKSDNREMIRELSEKVDGIHSRINDLVRGVSKLEGTVEEIRRK